MTERGAGSPQSAPSTISSPVMISLEAGEGTLQAAPVHCAGTRCRATGTVHLGVSVLASRDRASSIRRTNSSSGKRATRPKFSTAKRRRHNGERIFLRGQPHCLRQMPHGLGNRPRHRSGEQVHAPRRAIPRPRRAKGRRRPRAPCLFWRKTRYRGIRGGAPPDRFAAGPPGPPCNRRVPARRDQRRSTSGRFRGGASSDWAICRSARKHSIARS